MSAVRKVDFASVDGGRFPDRRAAGRKLAGQLSYLRDEHPLVLGLPRGGVPVAFEVASALAAPLDVLVVRKLGAPTNPELAIGAVGEGGIALVREDDCARLGIEQSELAGIVEASERELDRLLQQLRGGRASVPVEGETVIVVDDGMATGSTVLAAVRVLRMRGAARVVLACPVSSSQAVELLCDEVDELVVLEVPRYLMAVGYHYEDFSPVSSDEVVKLLEEAGARPAAEHEGVLDGHPTDGAGAISGQVLLNEDGVDLTGDLMLPAGAKSLVLFAHGSGSSRMSPRNQSVAHVLNRAGQGTLLFDLLTAQEAAHRSNVFDIDLLASRLTGATRWVRQLHSLRELELGYFGASTGAAAALIAAAALPEEVGAVVSRGGRPDLAAAQLANVQAPTLLIVGGDDRQVLELNRKAAGLLHCEQRLVVVPGATHLFEEAGALETVAELARDWFSQHLEGSESTTQQGDRR